MLMSEQNTYTNCLLTVSSLHTCFLYVRVQNIVQKCYKQCYSAESLYEMFINAPGGGEGQTVAECLELRRRELGAEPKLQDK